MRVATYNIRHGAPPNRRADHAGMRAAVSSLGADVVALQEVDRRVVRTWFRDQPRLAARAAGLQPWFGPARSIGVFGRYGNALLLPPGPAQVLVRPLPSVGEPRVALFARVRVAGTLVTVVGTHLQNSAEAAAQLDGLLDEVRRWPEPWVLMGDLNLGADDVEPRFAAAGLEPVPSPPTFPAQRPRSRIDWIGVRGFVIDAVGVPDLQASDHRPIVAELSRPGEDGPEGSSEGGSVPIGGAAPPAVPSER